MFGVGRKKSKKSVVRSVAASDSSEDDNNEDAQHRRSIQLQSKKNKGSSKKKKKKKAANNTMLSFDPEDGGIDDGELQKKKSKKRKKHSSSSSSKHKKNSGTLGYGGLGVMMPNTSDGSEDDNDNMEIDSTPSEYNASALEKLKSEQKRSTLVKQDDKKKKNEESVNNNNNNNTGKDSNVTSTPDKKESREEEFISLSGDNVLTGEEAMAFAKKDEENDNMEFDHGLQSPPSPPLESSTNDKSVEKKVAGIDINADMMMDVDNPSEVDERNRQWEDITARRAGVLPPKSATSGRESRQQQANNTSSIGQIRSSLQPTISNLDNVYSDLETSISRHESTLSSTQDEVSTKEIALQKHGKALEYYQVLREDLATWMGALRELNGMVKKVEDAKCKLEAEMSVRRRDRFVEWGEDCTEVLESSGLLKNKVSGKDNLDTEVPSSTQPNTAQVDEFGRDLSSMASISRVKRCNQRRKQCLDRLQQESSSMTDNTLDQSAECSNDDNFDTAEIDEWKQRQKALMQAIDIIPTLVKDDYLSISNLCTLFYDWERSYPDDYKNCYADMSLVQMTSVLVRLELCSVNVLDTNSTQDVIDVSEFKWFQDLKKTIRVANSAVEKETRPRKSILLEVVQKKIVDRLLDSFSFEVDKDGIEQHGIYDPFSVVQTKRMCSVLSSLLKYFTSSSGNDGKIICKEIIDKILNKLISFLKHTLSRMTVPIADASKITMRGNEFVMKEGDNGFDSETTDAISYSTVVQAKDFSTLVNNILGHWYPVLNEICESDNLSSLVQFVFADIISLRLLPILTSLHDISSSGNDKNEQPYTNLAKTMINGILDTVKTAENRDDDWMLMTAPMRVLAEQWS